MRFAAHIPCSDYSGSNIKLPKILLNGNNICMVRFFDCYSNVRGTLTRQMYSSFLEAKDPRSRLSNGFMILV